MLSRFIITGGAGYLGSHIAYRLLKEGHTVKIIDKIQLDKAFRLNSVVNNERLSYLQIDLATSKSLVSEFNGFNTVIHFAANLDLPLGSKYTDLDLKQGTAVTHKVLETMRINDIKEIIFPSSSTIYGYADQIPTPENAGMLLPISLYGASKLASEALVSAFCYLYDMKSWIFRLGNVIGNYMKRGVIFDLVNKLKKNSTELQILGDGGQSKDYICIEDCIDGILHAYYNTHERINVFNLSSGTTITVKEIAQIILEEMNIKNVKLKYVTGPSGWEGEGWAGEIRSFHYDIAKIKKTGWSPKLSSHEAVRLSVRETIKNNHVQ